MGNIIKAVSNREKRADRAHTLGKMAVFTMVNLKMILGMVKGILNLKKANIKDYGRMMKDLETDTL
jgi:hypothetical protein